MSLLIKDVQVVDGGGKEPFKADVLLQKNFISAIGNLKNRRANKVIDGLGHYLVPGFIDVDTESDHYLSIFTNPSQKDFVKQGVTTILGGHCGVSLAPLLYGTLESVESWVDPSEINVNWNSFSEFLENLRKIELGVNFGTLVGHATIRSALVGRNTRRITKKELDVFKGIVKDAMDAGAFGISTGLEYVGGIGVSNREIEELIGVLKDYNGVYTTHMRNDRNKMVESVKETLGISKKTGVKTVISHLQPFTGFDKQFVESLNIINGTELPVRFDIYPFDTSVRPVYTLLPEWAQEKNIGAMLERVRNKKTKALIRKEWGDLNPQKISVSSAPGHEYLAGKTLKEMSNNGEEDFKDSLLRLMDITGMKASVFMKNINPASLKKALRSEKSFLGSNGNSADYGTFVKHARSEKSFNEYLRLVFDGTLEPLHKSITKITSEPAKFFGIKNRGEVKSGYFADLVILDKNNYEVKDVIVGGVPASDGKTKGAVLRRGK